MEELEDVNEGPRASSNQYEIEEILRQKIEETNRKITDYLKHQQRGPSTSHGAASRTPGTLPSHMDRGLISR